MCKLVWVEEYPFFGIIRAALLAVVGTDPSTGKIHNLCSNIVIGLYLSLLDYSNGEEHKNILLILLQI